MYSLIAEVIEEVLFPDVDVPGTDEPEGTLDEEEDDPEEQGGSIIRRRRWRRGISFVGGPERDVGPKGTMDGD